MIEEVRKIWMTVVNMVKRSLTTLPVNDTTEFQTGQVTYLGNTAQIELVYPYGLCSSPPLGSLVLMFNIQGQEENRAGMANLTRQRFKNLKEGEVAIGNYLTGSVVKFLENGDIEVTGTSDLNLTIVGAVSITAPTVSITSDVTITGDLTVTGDTALGAIVTADTTNIGNTHVHGDVTSGTSATGGPEDPPS